MMPFSRVVDLEIGGVLFDIRSSFHRMCGMDGSCATIFATVESALVRTKHRMISAMSLTTIARMMLPVFSSVS